MQPERLGRYRVEGPLGQGDMGVVLRARDPELGVVPPEGSTLRLDRRPNGHAVHAWPTGAGRAGRRAFAALEPDRRLARNPSAGEPPPGAVEQDPDAGRPTR